jgi:hypothetical protein
MSLLTEAPEVVPEKLVYPDINGCNQLLLIDSAIQEPSVMANSVNSSTFPVTYGWTSTKADLLALLREKFTTIDRIAIAFSCQQGSPQPFLDNQVFFTENESSASLYSENVAFIISLIQEFQVKQIDYLGCSTLQYALWNQYYSILKQETEVVIGASNDQTGNIKYGGDWTLESTGQDIESVYFNQTIQYYQYVLDAYYTTLTYTSSVGNGEIYVFGSTIYMNIGGISIQTLDANTGALLNATFLNYGSVGKILFINNYIFFCKYDDAVYRCNMDGTNVVSIYSKTKLRFMWRMINYGSTIFVFGTTADGTTGIMNQIDLSGNELMTNFFVGNGVCAAVDISGDNIYAVIRKPTGNYPMYKINVSGTPSIVSSNFLAGIMPNGGVVSISIYYNYIYMTSNLTTRIDKFNLSDGSYEVAYVGNPPRYYYRIICI